MIKRIPKNTKKSWLKEFDNMLYNPEFLNSSPLKNNH